MIVVSDTSAITSLLQIGRIELLLQIYGEIFIPQAVQRELQVLHQPLPEFIHVRAVARRDDYARLIALVDEGEAEAIALAKEINADELLIDEADGRRVALQEGLNIVGLLGVLLEAKKRGLISSVRQITGEHESTATFHVADSIKKIIFQAAGEL